MGRDVATLYAFDRGLAVPGIPFGLLRVSRTLASNLRRVGAEFRRPADMAPVSGVEPLRSRFVVWSPNSLGPRALLVVVLGVEPSRSR